MGKYIGVWPTPSGKFQPTLRHDGVRYRCGAWTNERDAALARDRVVLYFELAKDLNFPRKAIELGPASPKEMVRAARRERAEQNPSGYIGVHSSGDKWVARIPGNPGTKVGTFREAKEAAVAYDRYAPSDLKMMFAGFRSR